MNQVLALESGNTRALQLLQQMNHSRKRERATANWLRVAVTGTVGLALAGGAFQGYQVYTRASDFLPSFEIRKVTEVPVPPESYPAEAAPAAAATQLDLGPFRPASGGEAELARAVVKVKSVAKGDPPVEGKSLVDVTVIVRPYGRVEVDGRAPTAEAGVHRLRLTPGPHRFNVYCEAHCSPTDDLREVSATERNEFRLAVKLKPSRLTFNYSPQGALVTVNGDERPAAETAAKPFVIETPREKTFEIKHKVAYQVSHPGFRTKQVESTVGVGTIQLNGELEPL